MARAILWAGLVSTWLGLAGCVNVNAKAPDFSSWGAPPPAASIAKADPANKSDLLRENQHLKDRIADVESQNGKDARKIKKLDDEKVDLRNEMDKIASERDRYRRSAGG